MSSETSAIDWCTGSLLHRGVADQRPKSRPSTHTTRPGQQDLVAGEAQEAALIQVREEEVHLPARTVLLRRQQRSEGRKDKSPRTARAAE